MERLHRSEVSETAMFENFEESKPSGASHEDGDHGVKAHMIAQVETLSFAARLRMIMLLSLMCWALVIAGVALTIA